MEFEYFDQCMMILYHNRKGIREVLHPRETGDARLFQDVEVTNGQKPANRATGGSVLQAMDR